MLSYNCGCLVCVRALDLARVAEGFSEFFYFDIFPDQKGSITKGQGNNHLQLVVTLFTGSRGCGRRSPGANAERSLSRKRGARLMATVIEGVLILTSNTSMRLGGRGSRGTITSWLRVFVPLPLCFFCFFFLPSKPKHTYRDRLSLSFLRAAAKEPRECLTQQGGSGGCKYSAAAGVRRP